MGTVSRRLVGAIAEIVKTNILSWQRKYQSDEIVLENVFIYLSTT